jgi:hypothetical protein
LQSSVCPSSLPNTFSFTDQSNVAVSTVISSNIAQITGITGCTVEVSVAGQGTPEYRVCSDASCTTVVQGWTSAKTALNNNQYLQLRLTSSNAGNISHTATVSVGSRVAGWAVTTQGNCADASPAIGTLCANGSFYIGLSPDGGTKMYTTPCVLGQTWDGFSQSCSGTVSPSAWSNTATIQTNINGHITGESNTATLAALSNSDSPYSAAQICQNLVAHGQSDWYLPARNEFLVLAGACNPVPGIACSSTLDYWTSSESSSSPITSALNISGLGSVTSANKTDNTRFFCVRKD